MVFDWREYLNLARFLAQSEDNFSQEAAFRSAISRAYYSAFCYARNYARDYHGFLPRNSSEDHRLVRSHFQARRMVEIARKLDHLRQWRNRCDYNDTVFNLSSLLTAAIAQAQDVLNRLM